MKVNGVTREWEAKVDSITAAAAWLNERVAPIDLSFDSRV